MPEESKVKVDAPKPLWLRALTEVFGTFMLIAMGVLIGTLGATNGGDSNAANIMTVCLGWGLAVTMLCYTLGPVSGCHLNPSVSIAMAIQKKLSWTDFLVYVVCQIVGAFLGALLIWGLLNNVRGSVNDQVIGTFNSSVSSTTVNTVALAGGPIGALFVGGILEVFATFVLVFFILYIGANEKYSSIIGVAIGLVLWLAIAILFNFTGGSLNAARSLGTAIVATFNGVTTPIEQIWVYLIFPTLGGVLAAYADKFFHPAPKAAAE